MLRQEEYFIYIPSGVRPRYKGVSDRWADYSSGFHWSGWGVDNDLSVMSDSGAFVTGIFSVLLFWNLVIYSWSDGQCVGCAAESRIVWYLTFNDIFVRRPLYSYIVELGGLGYFPVLRVAAALCNRRSRRFL